MYYKYILEDPFDIVSGLLKPTKHVGNLMSHFENSDTTEKAIQFSKCGHFLYIGIFVEGEEYITPLDEYSVSNTMIPLSSNTYNNIDIKNFISMLSIIWITSFAITFLIFAV